jgi:hypothetical protein
MISAIEIKGNLVSIHHSMAILSQPNITKKHAVSVKETEGTIANSLFI